MTVRVAGPRPGAGAGWGDLRAASCGRCARRWLARPEASACPCGGPLEVSEAPLPPGPAERVLAPQVDRARLLGLLTLTLRDTGRRRLDAARLAAGAALVHWPRWLVDLTVHGTFSAEVAIPVRGVGAVERLVGGRWVAATEAVDRTVWELRAGRVRRRLHDIELPATSEEEILGALVRDGRPAAGTPDEPVWVLLPDVWPGDDDDEVEAAARAHLEAQVIQATLGERARDLRVALAAEDPRWTLALRPTWWIADPDGGEPWIVDGLTGRVQTPAAAANAGGGARAPWIALAGMAIAGFLGLLCLGALALLASGLT